MKTKSKSKTSSKSKRSAKKPAGKAIDQEMFDAMLACFRTGTVDRRKELLAQVAGSIAAGLVMAPSPSISTAGDLATASVRFAKQILKQVGIPATEDSDEAAPSEATDAPVDAAS